MGRFKEILAEVQAGKATGQADGFHEGFVIYHFNPADRVAEIIIRLLLNEEKKYVDLGKNRALMFHKATSPTPRTTCILW